MDTTQTPDSFHWSGVRSGVGARTTERGLSILPPRGPRIPEPHGGPSLVFHPWTLVQSRVKEGLGSQGWVGTGEEEDRPVGGDTGLTSTDQTSEGGPRPTLPGEETGSTGELGRLSNRSRT